MSVLRVCYRNGVRFDETYYVTKHLPMAGAIMGPYGVQRVEVIRVTGAAGGGAPPYSVMFSVYFDSASGLQNALQSPRMPEVMADIKNFYDGMPDVLIGDVVALPAPS